MKAKKPHPIILPIILIIALILSACYSKHLRLNYQVHRGAVWNSDSTLAAALISSRATRKPEGLTRLPGGGRSKYHLETVKLYIYNVPEKNLTMVADFSDLAQHIGSYQLRWSSEIAFDENMLYYQVQPVGDWGPTICYETRSSGDSLWYNDLKDKYETGYAYNLLTGETKTADTNQIKSIGNGLPADLADINSLLKNVPLIELGFDLTEIYPRPERAYIEETAFLKHRYSLTHRAVIEQIIADKSEEGIKNILETIDRYRSGIEDEATQQHLARIDNIYSSVEKLLQ